MKRVQSDIQLNIKLADKYWPMFHGIEYEPYVEIIADIIRKRGYKNITEVGCGNGKIGYYLKKVYKIPGIKIVGTEVSENAQKESKKYYNDVVLKYDYKLPAGKWEFVILASIIEHIYDQNLDTLFTDINKKLSAHGSVFVVVPNIHSPNFLLRDSKEKQLEHMGHVNLKSKLEWNEFFKKHGFSKTTYSFPYKLEYLKDMGFFKSPVVNKMLKSVYNWLNVTPFYYLRNSYWILLER